MVATWFQHCNDVWRKKNRCCESSRVTSPLARKRPTCTLFIAAKSNILSDVRSRTRGSSLFTKDKRLRCLTSPKTAHDSRKSFGIAHNNLAFYHSGKEMHLLPDWQWNALSHMSIKILILYINVFNLRETLLWQKRWRQSFRCSFTPFSP